MDTKKGNKDFDNMSSSMEISCGTCVYNLSNGNEKCKKDGYASICEGGNIKQYLDWIRYNSGWNYSMWKNIDEKINFLDEELFEI